MKSLACAVLVMITACAAPPAPVTPTPAPSTATPASPIAPPIVQLPTPAPQPTTVEPSPYQNVTDLMPAMRRCVQSHRAIDPPGVGGVKLSFTITATGRAKDIVVEGLPPELATCVSRVVSKGTFAPTGDEMRIVYPISTDPAD